MPASAPAIDFIDALGLARGVLSGLGGNGRKEPTLDQLLSEMRGFDTSAGLVILATTNRPEILAPELLRAGCFDRHVLVGHPGRKGRIDIREVHARKVKLDPGAAPLAGARLISTDLERSQSLPAART